MILKEEQQPAIQTELVTWFTLECLQKMNFFMTFHGIVKAKSRNLPFEVPRPMASFRRPRRDIQYEQKRKRSRFPDDVKTVINSTAPLATPLATTHINIG